MNFLQLLCGSGLRKPMMKTERLLPAPTAELPPLKHPWSQAITVGRGYELLRADLQEHLRFLQKEFGYRHIRFHGSFHDDVQVVEKLPSGEIVYRWTQLDHIYDFLVEAGFDPIVEINPMPSALASGEQTMFWYKKNVTPPAEYAEWERFMRAYIEHSVERYGIERVRRWYFEVWNEPDLHGQFWSGTMQEYYELYASCAKVLKAFDPELQVGGPATANPRESLPFASWCREHEVPLDFLSYHSYPQNEACSYSSLEESPSEAGMYFIDQFQAIQADLNEAGFGELPLLVTEWNTQSHGKNWKAKWVGNESCNTLFSGAAVCHLATACDEAFDMMAWWVASDVFEEGGPQVEPYGNRYQYYGMLTIDGVPKASYHAFRFLNRLRGKRFALELNQDGSENRGALITNELSCSRALLWNCVFPYVDGEAWDVELELPLPEALQTRSELRVTRAWVREGQGSAYEAWQAMGAPANLSRIEQEMLRSRAEPAYESAMYPVENGVLKLSLALAPNEFIFLEAGGDPAGTQAVQSAAQQALDQQLMT